MEQRILLTFAFLCTSLLPFSLQQIEINNQGLFTLGLLSAVGGTAFLLGRHSANNPQFGNPNIFRNDISRFPFFFRRKRESEIHNSLDPLVEELFQRVLSSDEAGCGLRLVCELGKSDEKSLSLHAANLQAVLSSDFMVKENSKRTKGAFNTYKTSLMFGQDGGDCDQLFPKCENSSKDLMNAFVRIST